MSEVIRFPLWMSIPRRCWDVSATGLAAALAATYTSLHCFVSDFRVLTPVGLRTSVEYGLWEAAAKYV